MKPLPTSEKAKIPGTSNIIQGNDRIFTAGQTGSGKTVLSMTMLYKFNRLLVIDSKNSLGKWGLSLPDTYTKDKIREGEDFRIRVVEDDDAVDLCQVVYRSGSESMPDTMVYIDEVNAIIPPRSNPPKVFVDIWQRGREKRIGGWAATQRPVSIPILFMTEAVHFFIFRLTSENDRKIVAGYTRPVLKEPVKDEHGFYYYNVIKDKLTYTPRLPI